MKKILIFLLAVILAVSGSAAVVAVNINKMSDDVRYHLLEEYGDRAYLDGISVETTLTHDRVLLWENIFDLSGDTESTLSFRKTGHPYRQPRNMPGLTLMWTDLEYYLDYAGEISEEIKRIAEEVSRSGGKETVKIRTADYYEYYPLFFALVLPDFAVERPYSRGEENPVPVYCTDISEERGTEIYKAIADFIKIPVLRDEVREITVEAEYTGNENVEGCSYSSGGSETFEFTSYSAVFSDRCFFSFRNRTVGSDGREGQLVDTSLIPGGYGIYSFSYDAKDADIEGMKNVYPLADDSTVIDLYGDEENDLLYLYLYKNGKYVFDVIDTDTMKSIAETEVFPYSDSADWVYFFTEKDFSVFVKNDFEIKVIERTADGGYEIVLDFVIPQENGYNWTSIPYDASWYYDGEKLIIAVPDEGFNSYNGRVYSCLLGAYILNSEEMLYYGRWACSLSEKAEKYRTFCTYLPESKVRIIRENLTD